MLRNIVYFILFCIFLHLVFYFFEIDIFELFDKRLNVEVDETKDLQDGVEIDNSISELEESLQELKGIVTS